MKRSIVLLLCLIVVSWCPAEIIELIDGTQISGEVVHAYKESLEIQADGGELIIMPVVKIKSIAFKRIEPRPAYATPEKALDNYLSLVRQGDLDETVKCYRLMYQKMMAEQIKGMTDVDKARMQEEMVKTEFKTRPAEIDGTKAVIPVVMILEGKKQEAEMVFIMENGEWKMAMPMGPQDKPAENLARVSVELTDGTLIKGRLLHCFNKAVHLKGATGELIELDTANIKAITTVPAGPRPEFASPEQTFGYYTALTKQGRLAESTECFRLMLQSVMASQIAGMSAEDRARVQTQSGKTKFKFGKAKIKDDTAVLKVTMILDKEKQTVEVQFIKENGEWKMTTSPSQPADK